MRHILVIAMILSFAFGALAEEAAVVEAKADNAANVAAATEEKAEKTINAEQATNTIKVGFENAIAAKEEKKEEVKAEAEKPAVAKEEEKTKSKKKKSTKKDKAKKSKVAKKKKKKDDRWNQACKDLLETSVKSTIALEKKLNKKKRLTREEFDEKIHEELLVVQLNAWVCAISSDKKVGSIKVEEQFLQDYSRRIQNRKL